MKQMHFSLTKIEAALSKFQLAINLELPKGIITCELLSAVKSCVLALALAGTNDSTVLFSLAVCIDRVINYIRRDDIGDTSTSIKYHHLVIRIPVETHHMMQYSSIMVYSKDAEKDGMADDSAGL